jgi:adenylate cyclase
MADKGFKRKLTSILSADADGYSRLMRDDEDRTICTLTIFPSETAALVEKLRGHVVDAAGDNLLVKFFSLVDTVIGGGRNST